jgi:hypothetical protein
MGASLDSAYVNFAANILDLVGSKEINHLTAAAMSLGTRAAVMAAHPAVATGHNLAAADEHLSTRLAPCGQVPRDRRPCVSRWRASRTVACALPADEVPAQSSRDNALPSNGRAAGGCQAISAAVERP